MHLLETRSVKQQILNNIQLYQAITFLTMMWIWGFVAFTSTTYNLAEFNIVKHWMGCWWNRAWITHHDCCMGPYWHENENEDNCCICWRHFSASHDKYRHNSCENNAKPNQQCKAHSVDISRIQPNIRFIVCSKPFGLLFGLWNISIRQHTSWSLLEIGTTKFLIVVYVQNTRHCKKSFQKNGKKREQWR